MATFTSLAEKNSEIYRYKSYIADKVVDLQKLPVEIRDVEDRMSTEKIVKKIEDTCADIFKAYMRYEDALDGDVEGEGW